MKRANSQKSAKKRFWTTEIRKTEKKSRKGIAAFRRSPARTNTKSAGGKHLRSQTGHAMSSIDLKEITEKLQAEWDDFPNGFFSKVHDGIMDQERYEYVVSLLEQAKEFVFAHSGDSLDKSFVKVIWYMPHFLDWQADHIEQMGGRIDVYKGQWCAVIENIVSEILGVP